MLLCRVVLGDAYVVSGPGRYVSSEFAGRRMAPDGRDSVVALPMHPVLQYPEMVIYDGDQAYCEYLLRYRRV
jgi:hypothetical protein